MAVSTRSPSTMAQQPESTKRMAVSALAQLASNCVQCGLASTRTQVVFGDGNPDGPLLIVGEGPGMNEDLEGRPFVGRAGQLLDECLAEQTIDRRHIFITNVVRCRPTLRQEKSVRNRPPTPEEISACLPWLQQTIAIIRPLVILCLGAPSAKTIIKPDFRITQERGQWFSNDYAPNIIASWHPSYVMRMHGDAYSTARAQLVGDIAAARQRVKDARRNQAPLQEG